MDSARTPLRSVFDYLGFMVYATIVGWGLPDREAADAAHPRNHVGAAEPEQPLLTLVPPSEMADEVTPVPVASDERFSNAA
jgi:hypothetical protein